MIRYLGFLKSVPLLGWMYDGMLKLWTLITKPQILDWMDEVEAEVSSWDNVTMRLHKYGGIQFDYNGKEIGHIHSNGLLDMLLNRKLKGEFMTDGRIQDHHSFKNSGWISFYLKNAEDKYYAIALLRLGYEIRAAAIKKAAAAVNTQPQKSSVDATRPGNSNLGSSWRPLAHNSSLNF